MKIGGFGLIADYEKMSVAGYDYAELDMPEIEELSEEEFNHFREQVEKLGFPALSGARILPVSTPLFFTNGFAPTDLKEYLTKSCKRAQKLGIYKVILGNGKARSLLSEKDIEKERIFIEFLRMLAEITSDCDQELIIEPLGPKYSNYINTIPQAVELIEKVGMHNVYTMADLRHMVWSNEPYDNVITYIDYIHHVHIDYPHSYPKRKYPSISDDFDYSKFLNALKESEYNNTLTIEADIPEDWNKAYQQVIEILRPIFDN
jgi:sugar phosphate isomerase/epimerase